MSSQHGTSQHKRPRGKRGNRAKYLQPVPPLMTHWQELPPETPAVLWCRVSTRAQRDNLANQVAVLTTAVRACGGEIVDVCKHVGQGGELGGLSRAAAKAAAAGAVVVACTPNRFVRGYGGASQPGPDQLDELRALINWAGGLTLATLTPPTAPPSQQQAYLTKLGNQQRPPARPPAGYKKRQRLALQPLALAKLEEGLSVRAVADDLGVARSTVADWKKMAK